MGADIYYDSEKYKKAFDDAGNGNYDTLREYNESEDYFRDSYNNSSVFWQMGLSWWEDVGNMLDEDGNLPIWQAKQLRQMIQERPIVRENITWEDWETSKPVVLTEEQRTEWFEFFTKQREDFLKMLDRSIENESPLICSI